MSQERTSPPWLPLLAGLALVAFIGLALGPERVLHVARGVARAPKAPDLLPAAGWSMLRMTASYAVSLLFAWAAGYYAATRAGAARVILPLLMPSLVVALAFRSVQACGAFDLPYVMTGGGPGGATETVSLYAYQNYFRYLDFGYGSAIAVQGVALAAALAWAAKRLAGARGRPA